MNHPSRRRARASFHSPLLLLALIICALLGAPNRAQADPLYAQSALTQVFLNQSPQAHVTEHFYLIHNSESAWSKQMGRLLENLYGSFYNDLTAVGFDLGNPDEHMAWVCFENEGDFHNYAMQNDYMDASWTEGYYSSRTNRVALVRAIFSPPNNGLTTVSSAGVSEVTFDTRRISHELAHQLTYNSGLLRRGVMNPVWLTEGLATNFEADSPGDTGFLDDVNWSRWSRLVEIERQNRLVPLDEFIVMAQFRPWQDVALCDLYAQADGFFNFLLARHPQSLKSFMARLAQAEQGKRSAREFNKDFTESFGSLKKIDADWLAFIREVDGRIKK